MPAAGELPGRLASCGIQPPIVKGLGAGVLPVTGDVGDWSMGDRLVQAAVESFGGLDIVVNNAGVLRDKMLFNLTESDWDDVIRIHLKGHAAVSRFAAVHWRATSKATGAPVDGRVVNTSSEAFLFGSAGQPNYSAAKAGITALSLATAQGLGRYGVRANAICPRARTAMTADAFGEGATGRPRHHGSRARRHPALPAGAVPTRRVRQRARHRQRLSRRPARPLPLGRHRRAGTALRADAAGPDDQCRRQRRDEDAGARRGCEAPDRTGEAVGTDSPHAAAPALVPVREVGAAVRAAIRSAGPWSTAPFARTPPPPPRSSTAGPDAPGTPAGRPSAFLHRRAASYVPSWSFEPMASNGPRC
ncbi:MULTISPECIES: SDR family NAD(P)-dependent oxidoreductase [unclassified Streptomyces]|uniref:SDR family NAD(P)-dependent oxidoreductase n=1 Tax=unclassified Streptomyces TaxID=2593676 RepID=UPI0037F85CF0